MVLPGHLLYYFSCLVRDVPSLTEDIALTDPHIYISGPINDITYKLGDLVDLVEDRSLGFLNTMDAIARSAGGSASGELYL